MSTSTQRKAKLDALTQQVLNAQYAVEQCQATVNSLTLKATNSQAYLAEAESKKAQALGNKTMTDQLIQSALDLQNNANIAYEQVSAANDKTTELAKAVNVLMNKLIFAAEVLNKLAGVVTKKKILNPLISDELISLLTTAGTDANNAVALTLVALRSAFDAAASNIASASALNLGNDQATELYQILTVDKAGDGGTASLKACIYKAYDNAKAEYRNKDKQNTLTTKQLNEAQSNLSVAQVKLSSLQAGLTAANAAVLAS